MGQCLKIIFNGRMNETVLLLYVYLGHGKSNYLNKKPLKNG